MSVIESNNHNNNNKKKKKKKKKKIRRRRSHHFPTAITTCRFLPPAPLWNFTAFLHVPLNLWLCLGRGWHPRNVTKHMYIPNRKAMGSMGMEYLPTFEADFLWFQWQVNIPVPMEPMGKLYRNLSKNLCVSVCVCWSLYPIQIPGTICTYYDICMLDIIELKLGGYV